MGLFGNQNNTVATEQPQVEQSETLDANAPEAPVAEVATEQPQVEQAALAGGNLSGVVGNPAPATIDEQIVDLHQRGKNAYEIARTVFNIEKDNEELTAKVSAVIAREFPED